MKQFRTIHALLAAGAVALLAGCATVYEDRFQFSQGWRVAEVVRVAPASAVGNPAYRDCLRKPAEAVRQDSSYVLLSYRAFARKRQTLHPLPPNMNLQPGDRVYVKPGSCGEASIVKRAGASHRPAPRGAREQSLTVEARDLCLPGVSSVPPAGSGAQDSGAIEELVRWIS